MSIPQLSQDMIRRYASSQSWQRGEAYYHDGAVRRVIQRGELITAEVEGNDIRPYQVSISFDDEELGEVYCSCPYDYEGCCKHIVATLLVCLHEPAKIELRPSLEEILDRLNEVQTQALIQELVADKPELINEIEHFAERFAPPVVHKSSSEDKQQRLITVDANRISSQVVYILKDSVRHFEYGEDEDIATEEIIGLIQEAEMYCLRDEPWNAISMLTAITEACVENWHIVDDYGVDNDEVASELSTIWCETILSADLSEAEKVELEENLKYWHDEWGEYFDLAISALEQGWDYPPLKKVLVGNITSKGAWEEEAPSYADDLAVIRLKILARQERFQEYLYLAEAEGQVTKHLTMLVKLGRVEEAMKAAKIKMATMEQALALSQALINEQNAQLEALEIAQKGLNLTGKCQFDLGNWTSKIALELEDITTAINAKVKAFHAQPNFADYRQIEKLAGENWLNIKEELLASLAINNYWDIDKAKVDIYLHEGLIEQAISVVDKLHYDYQGLIQRVMDKALEVNPDWVISNACRRAESIMDAGKAKYYQEAVEWLKKACNAYLASNRKQEWSDYRTKLMVVHSRKRKLMGLMQNLI
jgi:uncharacterized Zn finger protein